MAANRDTRVTVEPDTLAPPQALDAERSVLAAMMLMPEAARQAAAILTPEAFYRTAHSTIFRAIVALAERGVTCDLVTVTAALERDGLMESVGRDTVVQVIGMGTTAANLPYHARIVADAYARRRAQKALDAASEEARAGSKPLGDVLERLRAETEALDRPSASVAFLDMSIPAPPIEWIVPGWIARREIAVFASGAGAGKSTTIADLLVSIAVNRPWCSTMPIAVGESGPVIYFDEEQGGEEVLRLFQRLYGQQAHPNLHLCSMQGVLLATPEGRQRIESAVREIRPFVVALDTVAQVFAGVDLNNLEEVGAIFRFLFHLRDKYGVTTILITHYRKAFKDEGDLMALERVFGSVGFEGNPSTVWTAQRQDGQALEVRQVKRRGARTQKLSIAYAENEAGEITLTAEPLETADDTRSRAERWVVQFVTGKEAVRTGDIRSAAEAAGFPGRTTERAMNQLVGIGRLEHVSRGVWRLAGQSYDETSANLPPSVKDGGGTRTQVIEF